MVDDRAIPINAPAASASGVGRRHDAPSEPEDASLLDPPKMSDLPVTTPEARQAKHKLVIEGMRTGRGQPILRLIHNVATPGIEAPPPSPAAPEASVKVLLPENPPLIPRETLPRPPSPPVRKSKTTTIPRDETARAMCLNIQDSELRFLMRLYQEEQRERGEPFVSQGDMLRQWGVNVHELYETDALGRLIGFTVERDESIGHNALGRGATTYKRKGQLVTIPPEQFLKRITPGSEAPAETCARRAKSKRAHRSERERQRAAKSRAATKARRRRVNDLNCRASAIGEVLVPGKWMTVKRVAPDLQKSPAFKGLTGTSLHRAIERELNKPPLCDMIQERKKATARRGFSIKMFRLK